MALLKIRFMLLLPVKGTFIQVYINYHYLQVHVAILVTS